MLGLQPLTLARAVLAWRWDPFAAVAVLLGGGLYLAGVRRLRARGESWPRGRSVLFGFGLVGVVLATMSAIGVYQDALFSLRATQVVVLLMIAPLALALGAPVTLLLESVPNTTRTRLESVLRGRTARLLAFPATTSALFIGLPWLLYFTAWYPAVLRDPWWDALLKAVLLLVGFLYFWTRLQLDPVPRNYPQLVSLWIALVEVVFDAALGLTLWLGNHLVAGDYYLSLGRTWGPDPRTDQILGAGVLWLLGDLAGLPFLGALVRGWMRYDEQRAAEIDRELDKGAATPPTGPPDTGQQDKQQDNTTRLWWEDDPQLAERFRRPRP